MGITGPEDKRIRLATRWAAVLVAGTVGLTVPQVHAAPPPDPVEDPSPEDLSRARELYDNGKSLYDEGSYAGAAMAFEESYKLSGDINLLYNVSLAYDRAGDFENALHYLEFYRALAPESERPKLGEKVESLKMRLAKQEEAGTDPASDDQASDGGGGGGVTSDPSRRGEDTAERDEQKIFTPAAAVLTAVAGVGFGLATGFGISSLQRTSAAKDDCSGDLCEQRSSDNLDKAKNRALVADISVGVGAAASVAVIAILIANAVKRKKARAANAAARIRPMYRGFSVAF